MSTSIGEVSSLEGIVRAINPITQENRTLNIGDPVFAGETIATSENGGILVGLDNGETLTLGRRTQMILDEDVFSMTSIDIETEAIINNNISALQQAVLEGNIETLEEASEGGLQFIHNTAEEEVAKLSGHNTTVHAQEISNVEVNHFSDLLQDEQKNLENTQTTNEDKSLIIEAVTQSVGLSGDNLRIISMSQSANGTAVINPDGTITYTPKANFNGTDSFSYVVGDEFGDTNATTISIVIDPGNNVPIAVNDMVEIAINNSTDIDVLTKNNNDKLTVTEVLEVTNGTVDINTDGTLRYTPLAGFYGTDNFTYATTDDSGGLSWAIVYIDITPINDAPSVIAEHNFVTEDSVVAGVIDFLNTDGTATIAITPDNTLPEGLTLNDNGSYTFDASSYDYLANGVTEVITIPLTITDKDGATTTTTLTLTITGSNDAAIIEGVDTGTITEDDAETLITSGTLTTADETVFTDQAVTETYDSVAPNTNDTWTYSSDNTQPVIQVLSTTDSLVETITVTSVDDTDDTAIIGSTDTDEVAEDEAKTLTTSGALIVTDTDESETKFTALTATETYNSVALNADDTWIYSSDNTQPVMQALSTTDSLADTITVTSVDDTDNTAITSGTDMGGETEEDAAAIVSSDNVVQNKTDIALSTSGILTSSEVGKTFTASTIVGTNGTFSIEISGAWTFTVNNAFDSLNVGDSVSETFNVTNIDGTVSAIIIQITSTNDSPNLTLQSTEIMEQNGENATITASDIDGTITSTTPRATNETVVVNSDGTIETSTITINTDTGASTPIPDVSLDTITVTKVPVEGVDLGISDDHVKENVSNQYQHNSSVDTGADNDYMALLQGDTISDNLGTGNDTIERIFNVNSSSLFANGAGIDGNDGGDTFKLIGNSSDNTITDNEDDTHTITGKNEHSWDIRNIENLEFDDITIPMSTPPIITTYEYAITLNGRLVNTDSSEILSSININNLPVGITLNDSTGTEIVANEDGTYTVAIDVNGDATIVIISNTAITNSDLEAITSSITSTESNGESTTIQTSFISSRVVPSTVIAASDELGDSLDNVDFDYANNVFDLSEVITGSVDAGTLSNYLNFTFGGTDEDANMDVISVSVDADTDAAITNDITVINIQDDQFDIDNINDINIDFQDN